MKKLINVITDIFLVLTLFFTITKEFCFLHIAGQPCVAYDVAINSAFFTKVENSLLFQTFLITIAMEGLEDKYKMELDKNGTQR